MVRRGRPRQKWTLCFLLLLLFGAFCLFSLNLVFDFFFFVSLLLFVEQVGAGKMVF